MPKPDGNYLFVPDVGADLSGTLYELAEAGGYSENSVVLIPYKNPMVQAPKSLFYKIKSKKRLHENEIALSGSPLAAITLTTKTTKEDYIRKTVKLKEQIQRGNIYEINYCIEFYAENIRIDPWQIFKKFYQLAKAPYSALLKVGDEFIICGSPELFLKKEGNKIFSKPIKGTIRRGATPAEDEELKSALYNSLKERTENVMAVDVARNDLSRFAEKGSVTVNKLYNIETFETVHQMVSTVSCEMKKNTTFEQMMEAAFPMASMTGAPKIRAMRLIGEFEDFERKNYSGSMGIIDESGDFSLSVIIRSIFYNQQTKRLSVAVGGAITYLSEPEKEYEECLLKAQAMMRALGVD